jgi:hypothetical protein
LRLAQLCFELAIVPLESEDPRVARRCEVLQALVYADRPFKLAGRRLRCLPDPDRYVDIPPAMRVFAEITRTEYIIRQAVAVPKPERHAGEKQLSVSITDRTGLERDPVR